MTDLSTHRKIIRLIAKKWPDASPFAAHEVAREAPVSVSSVQRTLGRLVDIGFLYKSKTAFKGRFYSVSATWPLRVEDAIEGYEMAKVMDL